MGDDGVFKAHRAVDDLVEGAVAAAGVEADILSGGAGSPGPFGQIPGPPGDGDGVGDGPAPQHGVGRGLDLGRPVAETGGGIDEKQMLHGRPFSP